MQNVLFDVCEKFHYDRLRNDRALGNGKSNNNDNNHNNNVRSHGDPFLGPQIRHSSLMQNILINVV